MKKFIAALLAVLMLATLCACGNAKVSGSDVDSTPSGPSTDTDIPENIDELVAASTLKDILGEISQNLHDSTAGSSLTASAYAGRILDLNAQGQLTKKLITETAETFYTGLDTEAATEFATQLDLVYNAAVLLCGETGTDALAASGYEAESFPWNAKDAKTVFTAIYDGAGLTMPN